MLNVKIKSHEICPVQSYKKFNGYQIIKHELERTEKTEYTPINIIYEPIHEENVPVLYYFTDRIHFAYRSYLGENVKGEEQIKHQTVRQCPYCEVFIYKK